MLQIEKVVQTAFEMHFGNIHQGVGCSRLYEILYAASETILELSGAPPTLGVEDITPS